MSIVVEDVVPEEYRMIKHTNYTEVKKYIHSYMVSKRNASDLENIKTFVPNEQANGCARIDAEYTISTAAKSHIKTVNKDEYWADQHKRFPHLIVMQENET